MPFEFRLPDIGEGVREGEIVRWLVDVGDAVKEEQVLVEIMTDKVNAELPSPVSGKVIRLGGQVGDVIEVGQPLVVIATPEDAEDKQAEPEAAERPGLGPLPGSAPTLPADAEVAPVQAPPRVEAPAPPPHSNGPRGPVLAVPAVRRLARELNVDLAEVSGSGPGGMIVESDVRAAAGRAGAQEVAAEAAPAPAARPGAEGGKRIPLRGVRRIIAQHLLESHRNTAPYTYVEEADFTELVSLRERVQPMAEKAGVRLTYLPFILAAVSMALREHPTINATVDPETGDLTLSEEQHVGVAVHTDEGLVVPVIRNLEQRNLLSLAREIERLSQAARTGGLAREELVGGTFSVTSLGVLGGLFGTPMLNIPQVAILGVHKIAPRPVVREGHIVSREMANLSLTFDHRYIDGYVGASFAQSLVRLLEDPAVMLFWLAELRGEE